MGALAAMFGMPDIQQQMMQPNVAPQFSVPAQMPMQRQQPMQQPMQQTNPGIDPTTISQRIQEILGAKDPTNPGTIENYLSGRFQPQGMGDTADAIIKSAPLNANLVTGGDVYNNRISQGLDTVNKLSDVTRTLALAQSSGNGGGATMAAARQLMAENPNLDFATAYSIAKSGVGIGNTFADGRIQNIQGAPDAFGNIERGKGFGRERGKDQATAAMQLPSELDMGERTMRYIEEMVGSNALGTANGIPQHPGLNAAIGTVDTMFPTVFPNTKDFENRLEQVKGTAFLQAIQKLKGTGQITEIEGRAGTAAVTRMQNAGSEQEFVNAAREYYDIVRTGMERARQASGGMQQPSAAPAMGAQPTSEPTATGRNGEKIVFRNGRWQPLQ